MKVKKQLNLLARL